MFLDQGGEGKQDDGPEGGKRSFYGNGGHEADLEEALDAGRGEK
jgi:hypothetical protein